MRALLSPTPAPSRAFAAVGEPSGYLTEREAARVLRLSERTLQRYRREGGGPRYRRLGARRLVYARADLDAWANDRSFASTSEEERAHATT